MDMLSKDGKAEAVQRCTRHFNENYNCCETVLLSFSEILGVECDVIPKISTFGRIHKRQHMCGALSGAVMAIGLKYGRSTPDGDRETSDKKAGRVIDKFIEKYGGANCLEVLGYGPEDLERIKQNKQQIRANICGPLIKQVAEWLWEELE